MKKILTLILAFVMCACLVNLNANVTKAEVDEKGEEIVETIPAEELDENGDPIETTPKEEAVAEAAEAFTEVVEGTEANDKRVAINNANDLNVFFAAKEPLEGYLTKSFVFNVNPSYTADGDITVLSDKTLDLNGHSLTLDDSLSFRLKTGSTNQVSINIVNSGKTSYLVATENTLLAMVQTKMADDLDSLTTTALLVFNINGGRNGIVFDGSRHGNYTDFTGLSVGFSNPFESYKGQPLHNVSVENVEFKNFYPDYDEYSAIGIGVLNCGANLAIEHSRFDNCTVGVASGISNGGLINPPTTYLYNSEVKNCYTGIGNGLIMIYGEIELEIDPSNVDIEKSSIKSNKFGLSCLGTPGKRDSNIKQLTTVVASDVDNKVDFYCDRNLGFELHDLDEDSRYVFAVPGNGRKDNMKWEGNIIAISEEHFTNPVLYSVNVDTDELYDKQYALQITDNGGVIEYAAISTENEGVIMDSIVAVETGKKVSFRVTETNIDNGQRNLNSIYLVGPGNMTYNFTSKYNPSGRYYVVTFTPLLNGEYYLVNYDSDTSTYVLSNRVNVIVYDHIDPEKKDESCEAKIGPTWHWNNSKGVCEETNVVNTYTR